MTEAQQKYALADVTHLRTIYEFLAAKLEKTGRAHWVEEEMSILEDPETYIMRPEEAWQRVRTRTTTPKFLAIVRELARFRESYAQTKDIPRNRVFKDDAMLELASTKPSSVADLGRSRLLLREARRGEIAEGILAAVQAGLNCPPDKMPQIDRSREKLQVNPALADLLRVLLKAKTEASDVASRLVAPSADLDALAAGLRDVQALRGWRHEVFGRDALRLCAGQVALTVRGNDVQIVEL